jgi:cobalamin-dependent methionine synthase I
MTVAEALQIAIPQDIELTDLKEAEQKLGINRIPRTAQDKMDEINAILRMTAEKEHCKVSDLQWRKDRFGAIHVRKRKDANKN